MTERPLNVPLTYPEEILGENEDDGTMSSNVETLAEAVVGHKIISVEMDVPISNERRYGLSKTGTVITLDNGKRVVLTDTDDCCAYTELTAFLLHPDKIDHIITGVGTTDGFTTWHIFANMGDILELTIGWSPGNPFYYGYGLRIDVEELVDAASECHPYDEHCDKGNGPCRNHGGKV